MQNSRSPVQAPMQTGSISASPQTHDDSQIKNDVSNNDASFRERRGCNFGRYNQLVVERQVKISRSVAQQMESLVKVVHDPVIDEYLNRVGQHLARNSSTPVPITIKIIDSDAVNALSLPDGTLYIKAGFILAADEEAELAGALAHQIAHIAACHAGRAWMSTEKAEIPFPPVIRDPDGVDSMAGLSGIATFNRGLEGEADYLGIQYMYRAGYDPSGLVSYLEKVDALRKPPWKPGAVASAFVTHPQNPDRIEKSQKEILSILPSKPEYLVSSSEFDEIRARLRGIENKRRSDLN